MKDKYRYSWGHASWCVFIPWLGGYVVLHPKPPEPAPVPPWMLEGDHGRVLH